MHAALNQVTCSPRETTAH